MKVPEVVYEDKNFLAIYKPEGLIVHAAPSSRFESKEPTLVDWLLKRYPEISKVGDEPALRPGIVHRLDRDTSGIMVVARNQETFLYLKHLFGSREIKKIYYAVVEGKLDGGGVIEKSIRLKKGSTKRTVHKGKDEKPAVTRYEVVREKNGATLVKVEPLTGRTHQIRVHLASIGHPICGDVLYGKKTKHSEWSRLMLHAHSLEFTTPDGERMQFEAELPKEFAI